MNAFAETEPQLRFQPLPTRGGEIAYLDLGPQDRPVDVVFCHATGFNGRTYRSILAPLTGLRILLPDLRGHGASTLPDEQEGWPGWTGYRDDLLAFLEATTSGPVVLGGHSMGGTVGLLAAAAQPPVCRGLGLFDPVLVDPAVMPSRTGPNPMADGAARRRADFVSRDAAREAYTGRGAFRTWSPEQLADYVEGGFRDTETGVTLACTPAWEAFTFRMHNYDILAAFKASRCPIRILRAEENSTARLLDGAGADLTDDPRITVELLTGTSHFLPMERPERVRETLAALVR